MSWIRGLRPSPSMIVAGVALIVALAGTAIADPFAGKSALTKGEKKQTKKIATNIAASEAAKATAGLRTASAFNQDLTDIASLPTSDTDVVTTTITTHSAGRILATGSAELVGADSDEVGACSLLIAGNDSADYEAAPDDINANNEISIAVSFAVTRPAGTYTAKMQCRNNTGIGTIGKDDAAINVYALPE
jgi:hypothetical protein